MPGANTPTLSPRALNRALLARQLLLERVERSWEEVTEHLIGLQGQTPQTPYYALWSRIRDYRPTEMAARIMDRGAIRATLGQARTGLISREIALIQNDRP